MTPERWQQIKQICDRALAVDGPARAAVVREACGTDLALHDEVVSLLEHDGTNALIDQPLGERLHEIGIDVDAGREPIEELQSGARLGSYRIGRSLGHGGMASVYLATRDDGEFAHQVAIKIIQRGMSTAAVLRRFRAERQILAALNHPNIARLLDGGTAPDDRPYLVMEYVDGPRIDRYCDDHHLSVRQRLELFRLVCDAVHYAHGRLVVHRDLKPTNILVTADGTPKLLDFGIAKLLMPDGTDTPAATAVNVRMMTPAYAAPEQLTGEPVTTATDVYALGVVLFELLTGRRPPAVDAAWDDARWRALVDREPLAPSSVAGEVDGELDAIVMKAMRPAPDRRYSSAQQFSDDVRRYLDGLPVLAQKDSVGYRTRKFLLRHRVGVAGAAIVVASLIAGAGVAIWQARIANLERARAERRFDDVQQLAHALIFDIHDEIDKGAVKTRQLLVTRAMTYLDRLTSDAGGDAALQRELASGYQRLGDIQGTGLTAGQLGDAAAAAASYAKARAIRERVLAVLPNDFESRRELAHLQRLEGMAALSEGKSAAALDLFTRAATALERLAVEQPTDGPTREELVETDFGLILVYGSDAVAGVGDRAKTKQYLDKALPIAEQLVAEQPLNEARNTTLASVLGQLSGWYQVEGNLDKAGEVYAKKLGIQEANAKNHPESRTARRELATGYGNAAGFEVARANYPAALQNARLALPVYESLAESDPDNLNIRQDLAVAHRNLGRGLTLNHDDAAAMPHFERALALFAALEQKKPADAFIARQIAFTHLVTSATVLSLRGPAAAIDELDKAIPICERLIAANPKNATAWRTLAMVISEAAKDSKILAKQGPRSRWRETRAWYLRSRDAWRGLEKTIGSLPPSDAKQLATTEESIAECDAQLNRV